MSTHPDLLQNAASFDWETLAPVIFFILYGIAQLFGSKKKKGTGEEEPEVDPMERARQIREEIRRKIEERRQENEPGTTRPVSRPYQPAYDPSVPESRQPMRNLQMPKGAQPARPRRVEQTPPAQPVSRKSHPTFEQQLKEQRRVLEEARHQQQEAREQALRMIQQASASVRISKKKKPVVKTEVVIAKVRLRKQLINGLKSNLDLRKAVLYREILDPPLGLK